MHNPEETKLPSQGSRMPQGAAPDQSTVPALPVSSSDEGRRVALTTGASLDRTTAVLMPRESSVKELAEHPRPVPEPAVVTHRSCSADTVILADLPSSVPTGMTEPGSMRLDVSSWVSMVEAEEADRHEEPGYSTQVEIRTGAAGVALPMDVDSDAVQGPLAVKRKKSRVIASDSEENAPEVKRGTIRNTRSTKRAPILPDNDNDTIRDSDVTIVSSNADGVHTGTEVEEYKKGKVGRPRRKVRAVDSLLVESEIIKKTGKAPEGFDTETLVHMTASDIGAQALEYLADIDVIRSKCGRIQGGLSGELKKRVRCLEDLVRVLQGKAESIGDPDALQKKIEDLIKESEVRRKQHAREEERRKRELSEMQEVIKELREENRGIREENRGIREEMRKIRVSIDKSPEYTSARPTPASKPLEDRQWPPLEQRAPRVRGKDTAVPKSQDMSPTRGPWGRTLSQDPPSTDPVLRDPRVFRFTATSDTQPQIKRRKRELPPTEIVDPQNPQPSTSWGYTGPSSTAWTPPERIQKTPKAVPRVPLVIPHKGIILKDNIQLVPPRSQTVEKPTEAWIQIGKGGRKKKPDTVKRERKRLPTTSAISIKGSEKTFSYADALRKVRTEISLKDLDIQIPKIRKGISGSTIIEITGPNCAEKADKLASEMQKLLVGEAYITRPSIKGELRFFGMDESIEPAEIREAISREAPCKLEEIKLGKIGRTRNGTGVVWAQCPKIAAITLAEKKKIQIGWTMVRIELLKSRPVQCHKCWKVGHVQERCKSSKNYLGCCFKCGEAGHKAPKCQNRVKCMVCLDMGMDGSHRMGSTRCSGMKIPPSPDTLDTRTSPPTHSGTTPNPNPISPSNGGYPKTSTLGGPTISPSEGNLDIGSPIMTEDGPSDRRTDDVERMET